jgi:arylsulfatase A-like enzyme
MMTPKRIDRRTFIEASSKTVLGLAVGGLGAARAPAQALEAAQPKIMNHDRPNLLMIAVDDLNNWVRCLGKYPSAITPNMDRLAARGTLFTDAHCPAPICVPGRTAVMSGIPPHESGCYVNTAVVSDHNLRKEGMRSAALDATMPLSAYFGQHGYHTAGMGKIYHGVWHSRDQGEAPLWIEPGSAGWVEGIRADMRTPSPEGADFGDVPGVGKKHLRWGPTTGEDSAVRADEFTLDWCSEILRRKMDRPFLLGAGFVRPHTPLLVPRKFFELYDPETIEVPHPDETAFERLGSFAKTIALCSGGHEMVGGNDYQLRSQGKLRNFVHAYLACISYVDDCIGRLLDALEASPYADNTIVALWSDHGWCLGQHHHIQKWALWEQATNVPLIIARPGQQPGVCTTPVSTLDLYPTLADLCALPARSEWKGHSLKPLLDEPSAAWPHPAITTYGPGNHAVRTAGGTLIRYADGSRELYAADDHAEESNRINDPEWEGNLQKLESLLPQQEVMPLHWEGIEPLRRLARMRDGDALRIGCHLDGMARCKITVKARAKLKPGASDAVFFSLHGVSAGFALYLKDGRLCFALRDVPQPLRWDAFIPENYIISANENVVSGAFAEYAAVLEETGSVTLTVDGKIVATGDLPGPLSHQPHCMATCGHWDTFADGSGAFMAPGAPPFEKTFPGNLDFVAVTFG